MAIQIEGVDGVASDIVIVADGAALVGVDRQKATEEWAVGPSAHLHQRQRAGVFIGLLVLAEPAVVHGPWRVVRHVLRIDGPGGGQGLAVGIERAQRSDLVACRVGAEDQIAADGGVVVAGGERTVGAEFAGEQHPAGQGQGDRAEAIVAVEGEVGGVGVAGEAVAGDGVVVAVQWVAARKGG
jgi:hypothetical protein